MRIADTNVNLTWQWHQILDVWRGKLGRGGRCYSKYWMWPEVHIWREVNSGNKQQTWHELWPQTLGLTPGHLFSSLGEFSGFQENTFISCIILEVADLFCRSMRRALVSSFLPTDSSLLDSHLMRWPSVSYVLRSAFACSGSLSTSV